VADRNDRCATRVQQLDGVNLLDQVVLEEGRHAEAERALVRVDCLFAAECVVLHEVDQFLGGQRERAGGELK
jgi:hypothetical protein